MRQSKALAEATSGRIVPRPDPEPIPDAGEDNDLDLHKYWRVIHKHLWGIIGLVISVALLTYLIMMTLTPIYKATATLIIENKSRQKVVSIEDVYAVDGNDLQYFNTQIEILKSRSIARRVVEGLPPDLQEALASSRRSPEPVPAETERTILGLPMPEWLSDLFRPRGPAMATPAEPFDPTEARISAVLGGLSITPIRTTHLVQISFESANPVLAREVANEVGQSYIESLSETRSQANYETSRWLADRLEKLREQLVDSKKRLNDYMESQGLVSLSSGKPAEGSGVLSLSAGELSDLQTKETEARQHRLELETLYNQIAGPHGRSVQNLEHLSTLLNDPGLATLKAQVTEAEAKLRQVEARYGPRHPERQAAETALAAAQAAAQKRIAIAISGLAKQLEVARENEAALDRALAQARGKVQEINRKDSKLSELAGEVETNRKLYEMFFNRLKETTETRDLSLSNARMLDAALLPSTPYKPQKTKGAMIAGLVALLAGIGLAFLIEQLDTSLKSAEEVEEKLGLPFIGLLPFQKGERGADSPALFNQESSDAFSESVRTIRTGIIFSTLNTPHPVLTITSAVEGEGKTTTVMNIALAMAQFKRVAVIEADLRKPMMAKRLQLPALTPGLCNLLLQDLEIQRCLHPLTPNLDLITAGRIPPNPLEILSSARFADLVAYCRDHYDMVLIDAPPVSPVSDPLVLSQLSDGMIMVVRAQKTPVRTVRNAISTLQRIGAPMIGIVLNSPTFTRDKYYQYYHYHRYGGYRTKEEHA